MLFGNDRKAGGDEASFSFPSNVRKKASSPIKQSINFSSGARTKAVVRRLKIERAANRTKQVYTLQGPIEEYLVGHLLRSTA